MLNLFQPVLADLQGLIQIIFFLVIMASGAAKLFRESKEAQVPPRPRPRRRPQLDPLEEPELDRPPQRRPRREEIQSEVDEFLRRVEQEEDRAEPRPVGRPVEARQVPPPVPRRQPQIEMLDDGGIEVDPRPRQSRRRQAPSETQRPQPTPQREPLVLRGDTVAEHVEIHLNEDQFKERASHLGENVAHSDDRLEARLHETFDHGLGSLSARRQAREKADAAKKQEEDKPDMAESLLNLLSSPAGVQQAVILNEVLRRPEDRF